MFYDKMNKLKKICVNNWCHIWDVVILPKAKYGYTIIVYVVMQPEPLLLKSINSAMNSQSEEGTLRKHLILYALTHIHTSDNNYTNFPSLRSINLRIKCPDVNSLASSVRAGATNISQRLVFSTRGPSRG